MLKSKFERKQKFKANRIFTDRSDPRAHYDKVLDEYLSDQWEGRVLVYYGFGGLGKTKLLKELMMTHTSNKHLKKVQMISVSLDAYDYNSPVKILMGIRKQIQQDCHLFDFALMQYFIKTGLTTKEIVNKFEKVNETISEVISDIISMGMGDVTVPIKYVKTILNKISSTRVLKHYSDLIEDLDTLSEFEIYQRLPYYLGLELKILKENDTYSVIFFDAYESMVLRLKNTAVREDSEEWLRELFISSEGLLMVMGSREMLKWHINNPDWAPYLDQHILEELSYGDAYYFLNHVPISREDVIEQIISSANGVPAYLDMCVDLYEYNKNHDIVNEPSYFNMSSEKIISRYLRHLSDQEQYVSEILSYFNQFEIEIVQDLLKKFNVHMNNRQLEEYLSKSMFQLIEAESYKMYDGVRQHLLHSLDPKLYTEISVAVLNYCNEHDISKTKAMQCLDNFLEYIDRVDVDVSLVEKLLDLANGLIDAGYWREVKKTFDEKKKNLSKSQTVLNYINMRFYRREGLIENGLAEYEKIKDDLSLLGHYGLHSRYLGVQFIHLSGKYDQALCAYKDLIDQNWVVRKVVNKDAFLMIKIKYADLLMLRGKFKDAMTMIDEILSEEDLSNTILVEAMRVKGHLYRFNYMYNEAKLVYETIEKLVGNENLNALGKIRNNLAETFMYFEAELGMLEAQKSLETNNEIGAQIEYGKSCAAIAIIHAVSSNYTLAEQYIEEAYSIQKKTGYKSGILFTHLSKIFLYKKTAKNHEEVYLEAKALQKSLDVYEYLMLPFDKEDEGTFNRYDWLNREMAWENIVNLRRMMTC